MEPKETDPRKAEAIQLRLEGHTRSQIAQALGMKTGGQTLSEWLRGIPAPAWTKRPTAKDGIRAVAEAMRRQGHSYSEIQQVVGVPTSTLSQWLKDVPLTEEHRIAIEQRKVAGRARTIEALRGRRKARQEHTSKAAAGQIQELAESELFVAGVVAYWAEGAKSKPWMASTSVAFMNSDPGMVRLFVAWLTLLGIGPERLSYRVSIHESADVGAAVAFWAAVVGVPGNQFMRTTLKRHNPRTVRKNVDAGYHGCLIVRVRRSTELGRQIAGWFEGLVRQLPAGKVTLTLDVVDHRDRQD
jgi:transposase